jgi:hypothetical protein
MKARTQAESVMALHRAERELERKLTALKRLVSSIQLWQRRVKYYTAAAALTDEERRERTQQKKQRAAARHLERRPRHIITQPHQEE